MVKTVWQLRSKGGTPPEVPAHSIAYLALDPAPQLTKVYWKDCRPKEPSSYSQKPDIAKTVGFVGKDVWDHNHKRSQEQKQVAELRAKEVVLLDAQMKKGLLDACVLHILTEGDTYGYRLTRDITDLMDVSESSLCTLSSGALKHKVSLRTYSAEHSGRLRRYYRITEAGIRRLAEYKSGLSKLRRIIDFITGGDNNG